MPTGASPVFLKYTCIVCKRSTLPLFGFFTNAQIGIIANFVFPFFCNFLLYLQHDMMLVKMRLDISKYNGIAIQGCRLHWSSTFLIAQLKRNWQYCILVLWIVCEKPQCLVKCNVVVNNRLLVWHFSTESLKSS